MLHTNDINIGFNGGALTRMQSMTDWNTVKTLQMKSVCEGESNVSGAKPWTFHVSELREDGSPSRAVRFLLFAPFFSLFFSEENNSKKEKHPLTQISQSLSIVSWRTGWIPSRFPKIWEWKSQPKNTSAWMVHRTRTQCPLHGPHQSTAETERNQDGAQRCKNRDWFRPVYGRKKYKKTWVLTWKRDWDKGKLNWVVSWKSILYNLYRYNSRVRK